MWLEKKILVPTDFSESAMAAADMGLAIARDVHQPLVLLHVYGSPGQTYPGVTFMLTADLLHAVEAAARKSLNEEADRLANKGVDISVVLNVGVPWEQILETARMVDAGLILMGTHGRRAVTRALLGSVADRIVRLSRIPVLTIRTPS
jgi:nucleotide-binding universal stress UspA family protein